ncbi:MAG: hypothetical protein FWG16_08485, partial [Micrococcales bacterium]|nr:hypothetical protein [Micrococcales bacterium]
TSFPTSTDLELTDADIGLTFTLHCTLFTTIPTFQFEIFDAGPSDPIAAAVTTSVAITGTTEVGETLQAFVTNAPPAGPYEVTYRWLCGSSQLAGSAYSDTYTLEAGDVDCMISVEVNYILVPLIIVSPAVGPVTMPPVSSPTLVISGAPKVGSTLTVQALGFDPGTTFASLIIEYSDTPNTLVNAMYPGPSAFSYVPVAADIGHTISAWVIASPGGIVTAAAVGPVEPAVEPSVTIGGIAEIGETLTADLADTPAGASVDYQWSVDGSPIAGEAGAAYLIDAADLDKVVSVEVSWTLNAWTYSDSASSDPVTGPSVPAPSASITGSPVVGGTLVAVPHDLPDGATVGLVQWYSEGSVIKLSMYATSNTLDLTADHIGKEISVRLSLTVPGVGTVVCESELVGPITG